MWEFFVAPTGYAFPTSTPLHPGNTSQTLRNYTICISTDICYNLLCDFNTNMIRDNGEINGHQEIPEIVIGRLPIYLRALQHLDQKGQQVTSSHELGELLGISPPQIRKDLSQFGEFGKQGTGYHVEYLIKTASKNSKFRSDLGYCDHWCR